MNVLAVVCCYIGGIEDVAREPENNMDINKDAFPSPGQAVSA